MFIIVYYSCAKCGLIKVPCLVKAREEETIDEWRTNLGKRLSDDHSERSINCHPKNLSNVMIPLTNVSKLGGPAEN